MFIFVFWVAQPLAVTDKLVLFKLWSSREILLTWCDLCSDLDPGIFRPARGVFHWGCSCGTVHQTFTGAAQDTAQWRIHQSKVVHPQHPQVLCSTAWHGRGRWTEVKGTKFHHGNVLLWLLLLSLQLVHWSTGLTKGLKLFVCDWWLPPSSPGQIQCMRTWNRGMALRAATCWK